MYDYIFGIDVSKSEFVVAIHAEKQTQIYPATAEGYEAFLQKNQSFLPKGLVVLETTGGYEKDLMSFLHEKNIAIHRASGRQIKSFIRSYGQYAKTDRIDALAIAKYGFERQSTLPLYQPKSQVYQKLTHWVMRRLDLVQMLVQEKNRAKAPSQRPVVADINRHIHFIENEIKILDEQIFALKKEDSHYAAKTDVLKTIEGIGEKTAAFLCALMPELGQITRRQAASIAGVAPHPKESGKTRGYASTSAGGRRNLRPFLFLAAMAAARSKGRLGQWYRQLISLGKKKMVALVALMRKIIVIANARIRELNFHPQHS